MQDPDPKCRHFVILRHFMAFWHFCPKANCSTTSAFSRLFPPFRLFHWIRLLDFPALVQMGLKGPKEGTLLIGSNDCLPWQILSGHQASSPGLLIDRFQKKSQGPEWHFKQGVKINVPQSLIFETFFGKQSPKYKYIRRALWFLMTSDQPPKFE